MSSQALPVPQAIPGGSLGGSPRDTTASISIDVPDYLAAVPSRTMRHRLLVLADQATSSLSNVVVTVLVAGRTSPTTFGWFAITMVGYQLALGAVRSVVGEPLLSQYAVEGPRARRRIVADVLGTTIFLGVACSLLVFAVATFCHGGLRGAFLGLALVLPFVLVQDVWRYLFIFDRPAAALGIDLVWLVGVALALSFVPDGSGPGRYVLAWGASGAVGAVVGVALGRGVTAWPHPWNWIVRHRELCWRYFTEFGTASGVSQLTFAGLAALSGAAALGAARAAWVVFGVLGVVHQGLYMALVPEGARVRDHPERLRPMFALASSSVMALSLAWMAVWMAAPTAWGVKLFGDTWSNAESLILPMGLAMTAGGALSGGMLGIRALADARRSLAARLRSAPLQVLCPLVGAVLDDARGFVLGLALANLASALVWWMMFFQAMRERSGDRGQGF